MPSFKQTLAGMLRNYPLTYPEPVDATFRLMTGNSDWEEGEVVVMGMDVNARMDYSDLGVEDQDTFSTRMEKRGQAFQRKLIDSQMEGIVENPTDTYFRQPYFRNKDTTTFLDGKYSKQAAFLNFPEDVKKDWAEAILDFHSWAEQSLRNWHLVQIARNEQDDGMSHWPQAAKDLMKDIHEAKKKLYPVVYGQEYEQRQAQLIELSTKIIDEILAEEKSGRPKARTP